MTGLELILTGLCIAALAWATVCHVWMVEAQREAEVYRQKEQGKERNLYFCYKRVDRLMKQRRALQYGLRRVAKREARAQRIADIRQGSMGRCLSIMQKLLRQRRALKHGVRAVAKAEAETRDQARQWVQMYNACNERAEGEFYRGYQAHKRQVADDLLGLAERYEEAAQ